MQVYLAQSVPSGGRAIQRTIVDESEIKAPQEVIETHTNTAVYYGLGSILLIIIAIVAVVIYWGQKR